MSQRSSSIGAKLYGDVGGLWRAAAQLCPSDQVSARCPEAGWLRSAQAGRGEAVRVVSRRPCAAATRF